MTDHIPTSHAPTPPPHSSVLAGALRHPLAAVVVGFVLTGMIGTTLTSHLNDLRQAEAALQRDSRRTAVREMAKALSERLLRMEMIVTAILQHSPPQVIVELKKAHDDAEAKWYLTRPEVMILAREVIGESDYEVLRNEMEARMARKRLIPLRACLQQACAKAVEGGDGVAVLTEGRAPELLRELNIGAEVIVDALYDLASITHLEESDPQAIRIRQRVKQQIEKAWP